MYPVRMTGLESAHWLLVDYCEFFTRHFTYRKARREIDDRLDPLIKLAEQNDPFSGESGHIALLAFGYELERGRQNLTKSSWYFGTKSHVHEALENIEAAGIDMQFFHSWLENNPKVNLLDDVWIPWLQSQFHICSWPPPSDHVFLPDDLMPNGIVMFAAIGERYLEIITEHYDPARPVFTRARERAHREIGVLYGVDNWHPLGAGGSLRDHIDYFFDKAMSPPACKMRRNMIQCSD